MFGARRRLGLVAGGLLAALFTALVDTSRSGVSTRRGRVKPHAVAWFNP